jgi:hypothetical protein
MKRTAARRFSRIEDAVEALPLRRHVVRRAFAEFCETGELPERQRLAEAVVDELLGPREAECDPHVITVVLRALGGPQAKPKPFEVAPPRTVREHLFAEAIYGDGIARNAARRAIVWAVDGGADVCAADFAAHHGLPTIGTVGLHVLGWPGRLVRAPYEEQARRLLARNEALQERVPNDVPAWREEVVDAVLAFELEGELPPEGLLREAVLIDAEFAALLRHRRGEDVAEVMAAFDAAATAVGAERDDAVSRLQQLVRRGAQRARNARRATSSST